MREYNRQHRSSGNTPWLWIGIVGIILVIVLWKILGGSKTTDVNAKYINFTLSTGSEVMLYSTENSKQSLQAGGKLANTDKKLVVTKGDLSLKGKNNSFVLHALKGTEIAYISSGSTDTIELLNGRIWVEGTNFNTKLRYFSGTIQDSSIVIYEQNQAYSNAFVFKGKTTISARDENYILSAGKRIEIGASDIANTKQKLSENSGMMDDTIFLDSLFEKYGSTDLKKSMESEAKGEDKSVISASGSTGTISSESLVTTKNISFTTPSDESTVQTRSIDFAGKILTNNVSRITINDRDAIISPVDEIFTLKGVELTNEVNNIAYKVYGSNKSIIEKGIITLYLGQKALSNKNEKPTVVSYPISDKNFRIVSPTENPYRTTENIVKIQGSVPANTVQSIRINGFQLTKFTPLSTTWYYFANKDYMTMNEGLNLYKIQYYGADNKLLSEQLFTIVKEKAPEATTPPNNANIQ